MRRVADRPVANHGIPVLAQSALSDTSPWPEMQLVAARPVADHMQTGACAGPILVTGLLKAVHLCGWLSLHVRNAWPCTVVV